MKGITGLAVITAIFLIACDPEENQESCPDATQAKITYRSSDNDNLVRGSAVQYSVAGGVCTYTIYHQVQRVCRKVPVSMDYFAVWSKRVLGFMKLYVDGTQIRLNHRDITAHGASSHNEYGTFTVDALETDIEFQTLDIEITFYFPTTGNREVDDEEFQEYLQQWELTIDYLRI